MTATVEVERMVDVERPATEPRATENFYTPGRVRYYLEHWRELQDLATPTAGTVRYDKVGTIPDGYRPTAGTRYVDIMVDIEREWQHVGGRWSLPFLLVEKAMQGHSLLAISREMQVKWGVIDRAFGETCEAMARRLGWEG